MATKARSLSTYLVVLIATALGLATTVVLAGRSSRPREVHRSNSQETDAPYCDGLFLGKLDAQEGRTARPPVGRWNSETDRSLFRAGYERGYNEAQVAGIVKHQH
jgi:hypothetical protein